MKQKLVSLDLPRSLLSARGSVTQEWGQGKTSKGEGLLPFSVGLPQVLPELTLLGTHHRSRFQ